MDVSPSPHKVSTGIIGHVENFEVTAILTQCYLHVRNTQSQQNF
jgi:hypothetical protein